MFNTHEKSYLVLYCDILNYFTGHTREGRWRRLNVAAFGEAMASGQTGLTNAALNGVDKQNVPDAERLLSFAVATFFRLHGHEREAVYVQTIAEWFVRILYLSPFSLIYYN